MNNKGSNFDDFLKENNIIIDEKDIQKKIKKINNYFLCLGKHRHLFIDDVIVFYNKPLLFTCVDNYKNKYLVNCLSEIDSFIEWMIVEISYKRLELGYKNKVSLYEMFRNTENNKVMIVKQNNSTCNQDVTSIEEKSCSFLIQDQLPLDDCYI